MYEGDHGPELLGDSELEALLGHGETYTHEAMGGNGRETDRVPQG